MRGPPGGAPCRDLAVVHGRLDARSTPSVRAPAGPVPARDSGIDGGTRSLWRFPHTGHVAAEGASRRRWRYLAWAMTGSYVVLLAVLAVVSTSGHDAGARLALWIVGGVAWPLPIAVAVTASRASQAGGVVRRFLVNLAGTVAGGSFIILLIGIVACFSMALVGYDSRNVSPIVLWGGLIWVLVGFAGLVVVSDRGDRYGPGGWAP